MDIHATLCQVLGKYRAFSLHSTIKSASKSFTFQIPSENFLEKSEFHCICFPSGLSSYNLQVRYLHK